MVFVFCRPVYLLVARCILRADLDRVVVAVASNNTAPPSAASKGPDDPAAPAERSECEPASRQRQGGCGAVSSAALAGPGSDSSPSLICITYQDVPVVDGAPRLLLLLLQVVQPTAIGTIQHHSGFLGQRLGPVACLAFHPTKLLLAAGATDNMISLYAPA